MRTAPHEFYGGAMVATPSVDLDVDDGGSAPTYFTAQLSTSGGFRSQRRGGPAGDDRPRAATARRPAARCAGRGTRPATR